MCVRHSISSFTKVRWSFWPTKATANPSGLSATLLWRRWTPWTPWKVNDTMKTWYLNVTMLTCASVLAFRWCWAGMGRDHYVKTDQWDTFSCGRGTFYVSRSLRCGSWTDPPPPWPQKWTAQSELKGQSVGQGFSAPVRSTSQHCPPLKWTSCPLLNESKRNWGLRRTERRKKKHKRELTAGALSRVLTLQVHKFISLCIYWLHNDDIIYVFVIYSAKMVFYVSLSCKFGLGPFGLSFRKLAKIKSICIFSAEWHLHWMYSTVFVFRRISAPMIYLHIKQHTQLDKYKSVSILVWSWPHPQVNEMRAVGLGGPSNTRLEWFPLSSSIQPSFLHTWCKYIH